MRDELEEGLAQLERRAWAAAYRALAAADQRAELSPAHTELLAQAAYLVGRDDDYLDALERAHAGHVDAGDRPRAVRCAFWLGLQLMFRGDVGRATGWLSKARRLLGEDDAAERGYLELPAVHQNVGARDYEAAFDAASRAVAIGERFGEPELVAMARHLQGRVRLAQERVADGLALLDEAMVDVTGGGLPPISTGLIYCSVIDGCQQVYALERAREWTEALASWCAEQPEMEAFTVRCLAHRAEIMQLQGAWPDAMAEARRACERCAGTAARQPAAAAFYQQAEVHRLRGELADAERAYAEASRFGGEPQPGLALLRLAQGRTDAALAGIRRAVEVTADRLERPKLLAALVEVALAAGEVDEADRACGELEQIADSFDTGALRAMAAHARGAVQLAGGEPHAAIESLRRACEQWRSVDAPYRAACARELIGLACRAVGDTDGCELELAAAARVFDELGAAPDAGRARGTPDAPADHPLTARELQVLRLVAAGRTNRAIADELGLSVKTIDRHVSNIFHKLDVSSRAAATAYAYEHGLV